METLKYYLMVTLFYICRIFPIKKNKIVVSMFAGKGYCDNGKAIIDTLLKEKEDYDIVWLCKEQGVEFPKGIRVVHLGSLKSVFEQCTAKIWIDNRRKPGYVRKRTGQYYINTRHGIDGLKKVEMDAAEALSPAYIRNLKNDSKITDLVISSSRFETEICRSAYLYTCEILETGSPRQDVFFHENQEIKDEIRMKFGLKANEKILLYLPTFRRQMRKEDLNLYQLDWNKVLSALESRFGGDWKGMIRLHPNISRLGEFLDIPDEVMNVTNYPDMEELMLIADCVISDYSSCVIEAGIAGKIGLIYAKDISEYRKDRNFYIQPDHLPFPFAERSEELVNNINQFNFEKYDLKVRKFFSEKYGFITAGCASKAVVERIQSVIG